jgi:DNA-binding beta-propeller fold protein YncE
MNKLGLSTSIILGLLAFAGCDGGEGDDGEEEFRCDPLVEGTICTIAGNGENGYDVGADTTDLVALEARLSLPQDTLTAPDGTVYILDWNNHRIRLLEDEMLKWVAGRGELGGSLDDPMNGDFNHPTNIIFDPTGNNLVMAAWHNSKIRIVDRATGAVTDTCGDGKRAYFGDGGAAMTSSLDLPASVAYDPAGNLVIMDQANQVLRVVDAAGNINVLAGRCIVDAAMPAGPGTCAADEMTQCPDGDNGPSGKWVCGDPMVNCAKPCTPSYGGDEGPATELRMAQPFGQSASPAGRIAFDTAGNLYFADTSNHLIRMIDTAGIVHRVAGQPPVDGVKQAGYAGDGGAAIDATLNFPVDLSFGEDGTLYFSDVRNHCIRAIAPDGTIDSVAGQCGSKGFEGDGADPQEALLNLPFGVEYAAGRLLIADTGNSRIRSVLLP